MRKMFPFDDVIMNSKCRVQNAPILIRLNMLIVNKLTCIVVELYFILCMESFELFVVVCSQADEYFFRGKYKRVDSYIQRVVTLRLVVTQRVNWVASQIIYSYLK